MPADAWPAREPESRRARSLGLARRHAGLLVALAGAAVLRLGAELAYAPALFFSDSWRYLSLAFGPWPVGVAPSRPSGYPLLIRLLSLPGHDVLGVTVAQHLAGLATGVLLYALLLALDVPRLGAALAAAVVMWDSYAVALEQFIMAEAFFTVLVVGALTLTVLRRRSPGALALAGGLLAVACTVRTTGLFVVPVWLGYVLWQHHRRALLTAVAGLAVPLLLYGSWHAVRTDGSFGLENSQGWFLYGRVAQIADCAGARVPPPTQPLCNVPPAWRRAFPPGVWIWGVGAPAVWLFGGTPDHWAGQPGGWAITERNDALLRSFALAIIRARPGAYLQAVASDFLRFFDPTASPESDPDGVTVTFPAAPLNQWLWVGPRNRYLRGYVPPARWPAPLLTRYQQVVHAPRVVLGLLSVLALLAVGAPLVRLGRPGAIAHRPEILLLTGSGLAMLLGSAVLVGFVVRYLVPAVPLLGAGGLVATVELVRGRARLRAPLSDSGQRGDRRRVEALA